MARGPQATIVHLEIFPSLTVLKGKGVGQRYPVVGDRMMIGRRLGDLTVPDSEVSSKHCEILKQGTEYLVHDLGSTNGTYVNGEQVVEQTLQSGDQIGLGRTVLTFEMVQSGPQEERDEPSGGLTPSHMRVSVGIYDDRPGFSSLGALVEDELVGFEDPDGTQLLELEKEGISCKLPSNSVVELELVGGPEKGRVVTLNSGTVVIGRYGTDVIIKDPDISRRHMMILVFGRDQIFLRDYGSTNGCYVNGTKVEFCKLQSGDTLVIGRTVMQLVVKDLN